MEKLRAEQYHPAFAGSVFTTAEFSFTQPSIIMSRNTYDEFGSLRAVTALGNYGPESGWFLFWPESSNERLAFPCPPGTTLLIPASVVRYGFSAVKKGETRYLFQQYSNAAVGRWVRQEYRSDMEYEDWIWLDETDEADWRVEIGDRVEQQLALTSRVDELYV